jgi:hypothetical protein
VRDAEFTVVDEDDAPTGSGRPVVPERVDAQPLDPGEEDRPHRTMAPFGHATPGNLVRTRKTAFLVGLGGLAAVAALAGIAKLVGRKR